MKNPEFPMRINKYLALKGYSTRRGADELISKKFVKINGRIAMLGDKVNETDTVEVSQNKKPVAHKYYAYNKPRGIITHSPQDGEIDIRKAASLPADVYPLGRLDKSSEGLIILTNDGRVTDRLLNPEYDHDKEYVVSVSDKLRPNFKEKMEAGVNIEGYKTKPCKVQVLNDFTFRVILTEGKKHQIRRMCVALFNKVSHLKRTRIMNIDLRDLTPGRWRAIEGRELQEFLKSLGL